MHAYLIVGQSRDKEIENILRDYAIKPINVMRFSESHGIDAVREINRMLGVKTTGRGEYRAIIMDQAHGMTIEAQNAFLKTLEEPPEDTIIILAGAIDGELLPTIRSRCSVIFTKPSSLGDIDLTEQETLFNKLVSAGVGEKVKFAENIGRDRKEALAFVENQLALLHSKLRSRELGRLEIRSIRNLISAGLRAYEDLSYNVNPKMTLFELLKHY